MFYSDMSFDEISNRPKGPSEYTVYDKFYRSILAECIKAFKEGSKLKMIIDCRPDASESYKLYKRYKDNTHSVTIWMLRNPNKLQIILDIQKILASKGWKLEIIKIDCPVAIRLECDFS